MSQSNRTAWLEIVRDYCTDQGRAEYVIADVVAWAKATGRWEPDAQQILRVGIAQCRHAVRDAEIETANGGKVRQFIAANFQQQDLWVDVRKCSYEFAMRHVREQCERLRHDYQAVKAFVDAFNANYLKPGQPPLQMQIDWDGEQQNVA
jgi:hypothetical protein